jgi:hypothetical protein
MEAIVTKPASPLSSKLAGTAIVAMLTVTPLVATLTFTTPAAAAPADAYASGSKEALELAVRACSGITNENGQEECDTIMRRASTTPTAAAFDCYGLSGDACVDHAYASGRKDELELAVSACSGISDANSQEECGTIMRTLRENER